VLARLLLDLAAIMALTTLSLGFPIRTIVLALVWLVVMIAMAMWEWWRRDYR
jgi:hypothetical protein